MSTYAPIQRLGKDAAVPVAVYGARANRLARLRALGLPVPLAYAVSVPAVQGIAAGHMPDITSLLAKFGGRGIVSVRSSPIERE